MHLQCVAPWPHTVSAVWVIIRNERTEAQRRWSHVGRDTPFPPTFSSSQQTPMHSGLSTKTTATAGYTQVCTVPEMSQLGGRGRCSQS